MEAFPLDGRSINMNKNERKLHEESQPRFFDLASMNKFVLGRRATSESCFNWGERSPGERVLKIRVVEMFPSTWVRCAWSFHP